MPGEMNAQEFATKVDWEGGIVDALDYGLHADDLDDEPDTAPLKQAWAELERIYRDQLGPAVEKVRALLPDSGDED